MNNIYYHIPVTENVSSNATKSIWIDWKMFSQNSVRWPNNTLIMVYSIMVYPIMANPLVEAEKRENQTAKIIISRSRMKYCLFLDRKWYVYVATTRRHVDITRTQTNFIRFSIWNFQTATFNERCVHTWAWSTESSHYPSMHKIPMVVDSSPPAEHKNKSNIFYWPLFRSPHSYHMRALCAARIATMHTNYDIITYTPHQNRKQCAPTSPMHHITHHTVDRPTTLFTVFIWCRSFSRLGYMI